MLFNTSAGKARPAPVRPRGRAHAIVIVAALASAVLVGMNGCSESDALPTPLTEEDLVAPPLDASVEGASEAAITGDGEAGSVIDGATAPDSSLDTGSGDDAQGIADGAADVSQGPDGAVTDAAYADAGDF